MQILYRYIFRRALAAALFGITTCCVIASLINLFDILDDVVKQKVPPEMMLRYLWINLTPRMMELLNVMMVLAGLFTMGELGRRLELVSMRAAGLSDWELLKPVGWLAGILFLLVVYVETSLVPGLHQEGDRLKSYLKSGRPAETRSTPFYVQLDNVALRAAGYISDRAEMTDVQMVVFSGGRVSEMYQADKLSRQPDRWIWTKGMFRKADPVTGQVLKYEAFDQMAHPAHVPSPAEFLFEARQRRDMVHWMSIAHLLSERSFVARQEIHRRVALAFSTAFSLWIGAWFGIRMQRFNAARAICLAILIGFAYRLIFDGFLALGVETGASWACHGANVLLLGSAFLSGFLTAA